MAPDLRHVLKMFERTPETCVFGPFRFSSTEGLWRAGVEVPLPPRALAVLATLVARPGELVPRAELLDAGWKDAFVSDASLLEAIHVIRVALGDDRRAPAYVQTVHRRGYRFIAPVTRQGGMAPAAPMGASPLEAEDPAPVFASREVLDIVRRCAWVAGATALTSLVMAAIGPRPVADPARYSIAFPPALEMPRFGGSVAASPDGRRFAFVALDHGRPALFVREASLTTPRRVEEPAEPSDPFFSPDGRMVGYFAGGELRIAEPGGTPRTIAHAVPGAGAAWITADSIIVGGGPGGGLARVSLRGGPPEIVLQPEARSVDLRYGWPAPLPDGRGLLFTVVTPAGSDVAVLDPGATRPRVLVDDAAFGRYAPTGHLIVERRGRLMAARFDAARRVLTGTWRPVVDDVASATAFEGPRYAFSESGALVYVPGEARGPLGVRWRRRVPAPANDGAAFIDRLVTGPVAEDDQGLSPEDAGAVSPAWRPDGLEVAFAANKSGPYNLFVRPRRGAGLALSTSPWNQVPTSWSPDGRTIAYTEFHPATGADVWVLDRRTGATRPLVRTPLDETGARFSPDGRWVAYLTKTSGEWQVAVVAAEGGSPRAVFPARQLAASPTSRASARHELRIVLAWFAELSQRMRGPA